MQYDSMDRVTKLIYPDQSYIIYSYNSRGLLEYVPNVIDGYDYNPSGQNAKLAVACGIESVYEYDHRLRLQSLNTKRIRDNLVLQDLNYLFDGVSNITGIQDNRTLSELDTIGQELGIASADARKFNATQSFDYDSLYRLTQAANSAIYGTINYRYDRIGNMIHKSANLITPDSLMDLGAMTCGGNSGTKNRFGRNAGDAPGPHAITATEKGVSGAMKFEYDANGNMTSDNGMSLSWDFRDRLVSLKKGTTAADYLYDYSDTRKKKTVTDSDGSASEVMYIDKYSEIRDGKLIKYVYAGNSRIARSENICGGNVALSPTAFYLHDHLGSTSFTLSDNGTVTEQLVNYPYGNPRLEKRAESANAVADYKFTGKERDLESGLQYFEARYYSGVLGRFNRVDPLAERIKKEFLTYPQKLNLYAYGNNNPIIFIDPDGKFAFLDNTIKTFQRMGAEFSKGTPQGILNAGRLALGYPFSILSGDIFDKPSNVNSQVNTFSIPGIRDRDGKIDLVTEIGENQLKNKSHFFGIGDIIQIIGEELGGITINSIHAAEALEKTGGGNVFAHSQGTSVMRGAFALLDPKIKCNIDYVGWGGQSHISIPWHGLNSAVNIRNSRDIVPRLAPRNWFSRLFGGWEQGPGRGHSGSQYGITD